jgi:hypothetical protein
LTAVFYFLLPKRKFQGQILVQRGSLGGGEIQYSYSEVGGAGLLSLYYCHLGTCNNALWQRPSKARTTNYRGGRLDAGLPQNEHLNAMDILAAEMQVCRDAQLTAQNGIIDQAPQFQ